LGEIGAGRFGRVNKMLHLPTSREMAVKVNLHIDSIVCQLITHIEI
jgi:hypothetical protein